MKSRKERRQEARNNGTAFEPQYNGRVITKAEYDKEVAEHKAKMEELQNSFKKTKEVVVEEKEETTEVSE